MDNPSPEKAAPGKRKERWFAIITVTCSFILSLVMVEIALRVLDGYQRRHLLDYANTWRQGGKSTVGPGGYLRENFHAYVSDGYGGQVLWQNNAAGFRSDRDFSKRPPPGVLRILSMGDSFTSGYRVGQHQNFSYLLENWVSQEYGKCEVLISCIEEPATGLYYLTHWGVKYNPHVVLLGITLGNDIAQAYGALDPQGSCILKLQNGEVHIDRNQTSGWPGSMNNYEIPSAYLRVPSPPSLLDNITSGIGKWFINLHVMRRLYPQSKAIISGFEDNLPLKSFDFVNGLGIFTQPPLPEINIAYQRLFTILQAYQTYCDQRGILFAVLIFPQRFQVQPRDWNKAVAKYRLKPSAFDLMSPNHKIGAFCQQHAILCIDPTKAMSARYLRTPKEMYLPRGDMHWNQEGHRAFFECAQPSFAELVDRAVQTSSPPPKSKSLLTKGQLN